MASVSSAGVNLLFQVTASGVSSETDSNGVFYSDGVSLDVTGLERAKFVRVTLVPFRRQSHYRVKSWSCLMAKLLISNQRCAPALKVASLVDKSLLFWSSKI